MPEAKRKANLIAFIPIGGGLIAVGIATRNYGLMGAGVLFVIIGAAGAVQARKSKSDSEPGDIQQGD